MDDPVNIEIAIILALIVISGFFSGSETALTAVSRARIFALVKEGNRRALLVEKLRNAKESLIGGILLGNNLVNIAAASLATIIAIKLWGDEWGPLYATIIMTLVVLIFAEILPKTIAINNAERVALIVAPLLAFFIRLFSPFTLAIQWFLRRFLGMFGIKFGEDAFVSATDVIRGTIELHHEEGQMAKLDKDMLGSILDLDDRTIEEIMIHRTMVESIDMGQEPDVIIMQAISSSHSRLPLWKDDPQNIIGVIHVKDILRLVANKTVGITREMIRREASKPWFVPETTSLADQLLAFRHRRKHFSCVIDEYGTWQGVVTLEDIIEEIVGDIDDEHDIVAMAEIIPYGQNAWRVEGTVTIRDLNRHLEWDLPDEDAATIAGLIMHEARVIPDEGSVFQFYGYRFTVDRREGNQVTSVIIERV